MAHQDNGKADPVTTPAGDQPAPSETPGKELSLAERVKRGIKITKPDPVPGGGKLEQ